MSDPSEESGIKVLSQPADFRLSRFSNSNDGHRRKWWSVLLEIHGTIEDFIAVAEEISEQLREQYPDDGKEYYLVPVAYDQEDRQIDRELQPLTIFARKPFIEALNVQNDDAATPNQYSVASLILGAIVPRKSLDFEAEFPSTEPHPVVSDDTVLMAVVDDGIGIANDLFRKGAESSRVEFAAIMGANPTRKDSDASFGRTLDKSKIDKLLKKCTFNGLLDENLFYTETGQVDFRDEITSTVAYRSSHGTHAMGLATGYLMEDKVENRPILCAAVPTRMVEDTTGLNLLPTLYLAFHMLVKEARRFRNEAGDLVPVVFSFSYGNNSGPHDGTGLFSRMFEYYFGPEEPVYVERNRAWLTLPAGNTNLARLHAVAKAGEKKTNLVLSVLPDDRTVGEVQFWMPYDESGESEVAKISVETPFGEDIAIKTEGCPAKSIKNSNGKEIARLSYQFVGGTTQRGLATLAVNPTASLDAKEPLAPSGLWNITIKRDKTAPNDLEVWVRRDETLPGFKPGGRQAFFDNPGYKRFGEFGRPLRTDPPNTDCPVRRSGTLSGFACSQTPIVVAAYTGKPLELSGYSSAGPLNRPSSSAGSERDGPDLTAKGDDSQVQLGVYSAGSRSGTFVRRSGTSTATPQIARAAGCGILDPNIKAREWALDPQNYTQCVEKLDPIAGINPESAGSGFYSVPLPWGDRR